MFGFGGARWNNYFEGKPICKAEVKARVYNLKNIKATIRVVTKFRDVVRKCTLLLYMFCV